MIIPRKTNQENKQNRPRILPEMGPLDWLLEISSMIIFLTYLGYMIYYYPQLPASIPAHFNGSGVVDDYSSRGSLWALPAITFFTYGLLTLIARVPHTFNFTVRITPENAMRQYTLALRFIRFIKIMITAVFFTISMVIIRVALKQSAGIGLWFLPVFLGLTFIPIIIYLFLSSKKK